MTGSWSGDSRLVLSALRRGARPNARSRGRTALLWAIQEGHLGIVKLLIRAGASIEAKDSHGFTPLDQAVGEGNVAIVKFLLKAGADVNGRTQNGTPLHTACAYRRLKIAKLLLMHGANPRAIYQGKTPADLTKPKSDRIDKTLRKLLKLFTPTDAKPRPRLSDKTRKPEL
jgi:uncharacterized protein